MAGKSFKIQMDPTFKSVVNVPRVGADPMAIQFTFKALDRRALSRMFDGWKERGIALVTESREAAEAGNEWSMEEWTDREVALQVEQIKEIVVGWGFSDKFTDENIEALVSTSVGVVDAILEQYNDAYTKARRGN